MALTEKLTNIANAIRNKTGGTEALTLDQMVTEINGITSSVPVDTKIFKFKHYTGEVLGEYTVEELANLTALPTIPPLEYVDSYDWDITLEEVKALANDEYYSKFGFTFYPTYRQKRVSFEKVQEYGDLCIVWYTIENELQNHQLDFDIRVQYTGSVEIDWGDGSELKRYARTSNVSAQDFVASHKYTPSSYPYTYVIQVKKHDYSSQYPVTITYKYPSKICPYISGMIGDFKPNVSYLSSKLKFWLFASATSYTEIPSTVSPDCFIYNTSTYSMFYPDRVANVYQPNVTTNTTGGRYWYKPHPHQPINSYFMVDGEYNPPMIKGCYMFQGIDAERKSANSKRLVGDYHIRIHPSTLTAGFTNYIYGATYDYSSHTSVPTLSSDPSSVFAETGCKILVPSALYNTWVSATNWSAIADYIVAV